MLLGARSWVLYQRLLSTTTRGYAMERTEKGRRYRSRLETVLAYLYSQANSFYGWGSTIGEYTFSLLQYGSILEEHIQVKYYPDDRVIQLYLPVVENGVVQINAFNFVADDYPYFLFEGQEIIRLKGMDFPNLVEKLKSMTVSLNDEYYLERPIRFRYNYIKVFNNKQFPVD